MTPVFLIGANFVRENRWPIILLLAWLIVSFGLFGGFSRERVDADDVLFFLRQQSMFIVVFATFLPASTLNNDRRSRRILLVLSQAISRWQYLVAIAISSWGVVLLYCAVLGMAISLLLGKAGHASTEQACLVALATFFISTVGASLSLLFATVMNSYVASALAAATLAVPSLLPGGSSYRSMLPAASLVGDMLAFNLDYDWQRKVATLVSASLWTLAILVLAALLFRRIDITVPEE